MPGDKILKTDWKELKVSPDACVVWEVKGYSFEGMDHVSYQFNSKKFDWSTNENGEFVRSRELSENSISSKCYLVVCSKKKEQCSNSAMQ